jgi:predicted DNA-binding transcriptional regulator YafY
VVYKRRFGVSLRSFRRDIVNIRDAGIHLDADPPAIIAGCTSRRTPTHRSARPGEKGPLIERAFS